MIGRLGRQRREVARLAARVVQDDAEARTAASDLKVACRRTLASPAGLIACFAGGAAMGLAAPVVGRLATMNLARGLGLSGTVLLRGLLRQVSRPPGRTATAGPRPAPG